MWLPGFEPKPVAACPDAASDEWFTPEWLLAWLPPVGFDPCYSSSSSVHATLQYDIRLGFDGLQLPWLRPAAGIVYCNPPYSDCAAWVAKCRAEAERLQIVVVALIPAKPGEVYWHDHVWGHAHAVGFLRGRIAFDTVAGPGRECGTFGSALIVWGLTLEASATVATITRSARSDKRSPVWVRGIAADPV